MNKTDKTQSLCPSGKTEETKGHEVSMLVYALPRSPVLEEEPFFSAWFLRPFPVCTHLPLQPHCSPHRAHCKYSSQPPPPKHSFPDSRLLLCLQTRFAETTAMPHVFFPFLIYLKSWLTVKSEPDAGLG